jgi:sulfur relay (sulfurtransferase) DsrC/TusE family protein
MESADSVNVTEINCEGDECKIPLLRKMQEEMSNPGALSPFNPKEAADKARAMGAELTETVLEAVMTLRERRRRLGAGDNAVGAATELNTVLGPERFHELRETFPSGPVARCCELAGIPPPDGVLDASFGWAA